MKKLVLLPLLILCINCSGDRGPQGPPGMPGQDGLIGQTFEIENIDFQYEQSPNLFSTIVDVPTDIEVLESDAILVYRLEINQGMETWSQIPQNFYLEDGREIQYVFNHTDQDIELLITGNFNLADLNIDFTDDQIFRFVVIPSDFSNDPNNDVSTYSRLQESALRQGKKIETLQVK